jgi:hypothetical protein
VSIGHPARIDAVHCTQRPALAPLVAHTGRSPAQSPAVQARHMRVAGSQKGVAPAQSALVAHCTQRLLVASQRGDGPVQAAVLAAVHCTQRPSLAHAGEAPAQSVGRVASHARHTLRIASHTGVAPLQSGSPLQPTHTLGEEGRVEHRGASPAHAPRVSEEHATQRPALGPTTAHTGDVIAGQSADCVATAQGRQARTEASHTGVAAPQSAAVRHPTQAPRAASQRGRAASQAAVSAGPHCTQRPARSPAVAHTGAAGSRAAHCALDAQATHTRVARSHTGVAAPQSAEVRHWHTPRARSQKGAVEGHTSPAAPGMNALTRPAAVSRASGRQSLSESMSR